MLRFDRAKNAQQRDICSMLLPFIIFFSVFCSIKLSLSRNFILMTVCSGCCCVCCARLWCWCTTMLLSVWRNYPSPHYTRRIFFYDPQMTKYGHIGFTIDSVSNGFVYRIPLRWIVNGQKRVFFCEFKHIERRKKKCALAFTIAKPNVTRNNK